jgi:hypothetical protein
MPDGRFLSKSIAYSEQLTRVSLAAEVLFYRLIPHADIEGRLPGDPFKLKSIAAPMRSSLSVGAIQKALIELHREGLAIRYTVAGAQYIRLPGFARHQKVRADREAASKIPADPSEVVDPPEYSGSTPQTSGALPPEVEGEVEVQVQGQVTKQHNTSPRARDADVEISVEPAAPLAFDAALARFLEKAPPHRRAALGSKLRMWRRGEDCPPSQKPADPELITAMNEYADDPGNWSASHLWTFVRNAIRRFRQGDDDGSSDGARINGRPPPKPGRTGMDHTKSAIENVIAREQAARAAGDTG